MQTDAETGVTVGAFTIEIVDTYGALGPFAFAVVNVTL